jgi:prepilin-type N-terminal cleavage/methylation domain-containing protein
VRHGLTLIELLMVIAIIAMLAALLFPALSLAKKKAIEPVDVSNMRQIYMAFAMYEDDHGVAPLTTLLPVEPYARSREVFRSKRDLYRKAYPTGLWPARNFYVCAPERSPFQISYAFLGSFPGYDTHEQWIEARANSQMGFLASPWSGDPVITPSTLFKFPCGDSVLETMGPAMSGPILRIQMDGSAYRLSKTATVGIGTPNDFFIRR